MLLELANGKYAGKSRRLRLGDDCRIGSGAGVEFSVPDDPSLGKIHFLACRAEKGLEVWGVDGNTVALAGDRCARHHLTARGGDWLLAGESIFRPTLLDAPIGVRPETPLDEVAYTLNRISDLFAMVNVADDTEWKRRVESGRDPGQPIAESFIRFSEVGGEPWLLHVTSNLALIGYIVRRGWGHGRIAFFRSPYSFASIREFCISKTKDRVSRFYDPRWLRVALRNLPDVEECSGWMGPVEEFLVESSFPRRIERWTKGPEGLANTSIDIGPQLPARLPTEAEVEAGIDTSMPLDMEVAKWSTVGNDQANAQIERGRVLGLSSAASLVVYSVAQCFSHSEALDKLLERSPHNAARALELFVAAANRRHAGTYAIT